VSTTPRQRRILLVEDEVNMARTLAKILQRKGYEVTTAANGEEAVRALAASAAEVIITDLNMPVMDGMALLRHLRGPDAADDGVRRLVTPPTVVLTGHGSTQAAVGLGAKFL
jgi:CheY-like chemotaxis protein